MHDNEKPSRAANPGRMDNSMKCRIEKLGRKWIVVLEDGSRVYTGNTRVGCFRYCTENNLKITEYQHGGK
jgi:hypothetical protein